jgi:hypothetical protein
MPGTKYLITCAFEDYLRGHLGVLLDVHRFEGLSLN